jgi:hypothetical protein
MKINLAITIHINVKVTFTVMVSNQYGGKTSPLGLAAVNLVKKLGKVSFLFKKSVFHSKVRFKPIFLSIFQS